MGPRLLATLCSLVQCCSEPPVLAATAITGQWTVFRMNTDGSGFVVLKHFAGPPSTDGASRVGGLVLKGTTLFGTTTRWGGPNYSGGTVFKLSTPVHKFT